MNSGNTHNAQSTGPAPLGQTSEKTMKVSPSQVKTSRACLRKWGFKILDGLPEPMSAAQEKGILGHSRIELYQKNSQHPGDDEMGKLVQMAMRPGYLPTPHPESLVEQHLVIDLGNGDIFHGYADLITHPSVDENGMPIVVDYKFTSNSKYAMKPNELLIDPQGIGYSKAAFNNWPTVPGVKNRWIYFDHKARKVLPVIVQRSAADLSQQWEELAAESRGLIALRRKGARAIDLKGNAAACGDYGGCPFASRCDVPKRSTSFFGNQSNNKQFTNSENYNNSANSSGAPALESEKVMAISLKEQLAQLKAQGTAGTPAPAQPAPQAAPTPAPVPAQAAVPQATAGTGGLAALQAAKGFTGVNPPASTPAPAPTPGKMSLKDQIAASQGAAPQAAPAAQTEAPAQAPTSAPAEAAQATAPTADEVVKSAEAQASETVAKKTRTRAKAAESAAPQTMMSELSVLYNAVIMKHPESTARAVQLIDLLAPIMRQVADGADKAHWALIPYNEGKALLAHAFDKWLEETNWKGTIIVAGNSLESQAVDAVLKHRADVVVGGLS